MAAGTATTGRYVKTDIPARLDRLPWSRWHWTIVFALGITWVLDGLEVTIVGTIGSRLTEADTLHFSAGQVGAIASFYIAGAVVGAIVFGYFTDKLGRKKLLLVTLGWYATFTVENAFAWNFWSFAIFRFLAANGIGGEYAANKLRDRRADPRGAPRPGRPFDQQQLVDRHHAGERSQFCSCWTSGCFQPIWAGGSASASALRSRSPCSSYGARYRRVRAGS